MSTVSKPKAIRNVADLLFAFYKRSCLFDFCS